jgi:type I restriction enzyme S subunit
MSAVEGWKTFTVEQCCEILDNKRVPVNAEDRDRRIGEIPYYGANGLQGYIDDFIFNEPLILIAEDGGCFDEFATRPIAYRVGGKSWVNNHAHVLRAKEGFYQDAIFYSLEHKDIQSFIVGGTRSKLNQSALRSIQIVLPTSKPEQAKIAEILSTVDRAIEQTEALIAKQQRIKTGLMQDLLTRGIDEHGNLRSEQTHKFKDSPLGRIPVEWEVAEFGRTVESAVDGPFGSNLKTDHYVAEPGVRVVRLGNIGNGRFLDRDRAWISSVHAQYLSRHSVQPNDLLIASLGDERHPFGRACIYTDCVHEAIVKADVFRIRCKRERLIHSFAVHLFNFPRWRQGLFALAQGVTRDRVNLTNMMLLQLPIPSLGEQETIASTMVSLDAVLDEFEQQLSKLLSVKTALMQDLLTGKKRVIALLSDKEITDRRLEV